MYDYHYNVMQKHYGDRINLMYTDTSKYIETFTYLKYINYYNYSRFISISDYDR